MQNINWVETLDLAETALFTANDCMNLFGNKERFRPHHAIINGYSVFIALDFEKLEWAYAYIIDFPSNQKIYNPNSEYVKGM